MLDYSTLLPSAQHSMQARRWALLALLSLTLSGVAPLLLIAGRASMFAEWGVVKDWFVPMLVIHVNLSVGLWFLAICAMLWSLNHTHEERGISSLSLQFAFLGAIICIALGPLAGGEAYTSNYIPVQDNRLFFTGIALAGLAIGGAALIHLFRGGLGSIPQLAAYALAITVLMALGCFVWSIMQHPAGYGGESYYEAVFWGGGHVLQIAFVLIALCAWFMLARYLNWRVPVPPMSALVVIFLLVGVFTSPLVYFLTTVTEGYHQTFFTHQMIYITGVFPAIIALCLLWRGMKDYVLGEHPPVRAALMGSLILYLAGGLTGFLIQGSDVTIPAHYHGSTGGITLASMGLFYLLAPQFGWAGVAGWRMARWQPWVYCTGQLLFMIGFIWAGGYDVARKTAGALDASQQGAATALQIYRFGGLLAVVGGAMFVIVMIRAVRRAQPQVIPA